MRTFLCSALVLALFTGSALADQAKKTENKPAAKKTENNKKKGHHFKAKIVKVNAREHSVTVRMKGKDGKMHDKVFKLTEEVRYVDSTGRVAAADIFENGNDVLVVEEEGTLKELRKAKKGEHKPGEKKPGEKTKGTKAGEKKEGGK